MAEKKINKCLNFAKGVACILVVFIHCQFPPPVGRYVISIARAAVPLFFMVSGYFCFYGDRQRLFAHAVVILCVDREIHRRLAVSILNF